MFFIEEFLNILIQSILPIIITTLGGFLAYILNKIKKCLDEKLQDEYIENIVNSTIKYIEQKHYNLKGNDKLNEAKKIIIERLKFKNILINEFELEILIECSVNELNRGSDNFDKFKISS
ncbi:MAG: phage holin, LLH family [Bacilli bacterium]|nr:phage holin, LLH family [Bacilli bacterium]